jgi:hypothetical protein
MPRPPQWQLQKAPTVITTEAITRPSTGTTSLMGHCDPGML